ncbi:MAG TPA: hypothetical protein VFW23_07670 [Tepidisphaeraceae bacterium]|nr:hypothetical protein [Tepidisphaeraceae bacterium]
MTSERGRDAEASRPLLFVKGSARNERAKSAKKAKDAKKKIQKSDFLGALGFLGVLGAMANGKRRNPRKLLGGLGERVGYSTRS